MNIFSSDARSYSLITESQTPMYNFLKVRNSGQANKSSWWIPRHTEAKKDAVTGDTPRGVGSKH